MEQSQKNNPGINRLLWGLGASAVLLFLVAAIFMYLRTQASHLWGYWPLALFLGFWTGFVLLAYRKHWLAHSERQLLLKTSLSGLLLGLAFPFSDLPTGILSLVGFVPFFQVYQHLKNSVSSWKRVFFYSFHTFLLWNVLATYWVANSALTAGLFAILVNSALMCIPVLLFYRAQKHLPKLGWVPFLAFWLCFEQLHYQWELNWPWLSLGNALATLPKSVQWYSYTGVLGGSLWILLSNVLIYQWWQQRQQAAGKWKRIFRVGIILLLPLSFSLFLASKANPVESSIEVVAAQPNVEPHYGRDLISNGAFLDRLLELSLDQLTDSTAYLLFPESTLDFTEVSALDKSREIQAFRKMVLERYPGLKIIAGIDGYHMLRSDEQDSRFTRIQKNAEGDRRFEVYNAAVEFGVAGPIDFYKKSKLVPGPELFPYPQVLFFLKPIVEAFGGTTAGRGSQKERSIFEQGQAKVAPSICYESVFGAHLSGHIRNGANVVFVLTNDAWWDQTAGHIQHLHYARLRAIEQGRSVVRSANTGISAFIDSKGRIQKRSKYNELTALRSAVSLHEKQTFYSRNPGLIARFAWFAGIVFLLNMLVKTILPSQKSKP